MNHIIAIGISNYRSIRSLRFANKDARELFYLVENNMQDIGYRVLLVDSEATFASIRSALGGELEKNVGEDDFFFFFFSGHGAVAASQGGTEFSNYLLPFDTTEDVENTAISIDYLRDRFEKVGCKNKLIIIDSCFSGSMNSKAYSRVNLKAAKKVKTFENTISGAGQITFTASKEEEEAIEDAELQNGLFTYYFLEEMQNTKYGERIAVTSIHAPVTEKVIKRAEEEHGFKQTPTFKGSLEGVLYLPVCKKTLVITPETIRVRITREVARTQIPVVDINTENEEVSRNLEGIVEMVIAGASSSKEYENIALDRCLVSSINKLRGKYEEAFNRVGDKAERIPGELAKLEAESVYVQFIGCAIAEFGNSEQMRKYVQRIGDIMNFGEGKSGLVALINLPEIVLAEVVYGVGMICLANDRLELLGALLKTKIFSWRRMDYIGLYEHRDIHYADALNSRADYVGDHIRKYFEGNKWIISLCPQLEGNTTEYQLQTNMLLAVFYFKYGFSLFSDYGRFYERRVMPLVARVRSDKSFREKIAGLLELQEPDVIGFMKKYLNEGGSKIFAGRYFWNSVEPDVFDR